MPKDSNRLKGIIHSIKGALVIEDAARKIVLANQAFSDLFGLPAPDDLIGMDCSGAAEAAATMFEDPEKFVIRINALLAAREEALDDILQMTTGRVLERDYVPFFVDGTYAGHLWHYRDITERKETELSLKDRDLHLAAITAGALDAIVTVQEDGTVQEWNPAAEALFGWTKEDAQGQLLTDLFIPEIHRDAHTKGMARLAAGEKPRVMGQRVELKAQKKDGTLFPCELSLIKTMRGSVVTFTGFIRDISADVSRRIELAGRAEILAEKTKSQRQHMAMISHDVRSPLHAIMGRLDLALLDGVELPQDLVEGVRTAVMHIADMLDELLEDAKLVQSNKERDESAFDLAMLVRECVFEKAGAAAEKGLKVSHGIPEGNWWIRSSKSALRRIIENLLSNAIKYTDSGQIEASVRMEGAPKNSIAIQVRDTGRGMSEEDWGRFANAYEQADPDSDGVGLGLAIVHDLVQRMGGTLAHQSVPTGGSLITVTVPIDRLGPIAHSKGPLGFHI
jgi:PAS domain S-box-containing protein